MSLGKMDIRDCAGDYDSDDNESPRASSSLVKKDPVVRQERRIWGGDEGLKESFKTLTVYERHKRLVNAYSLPGVPLERDSSKDVTDMDVISKHHRFLWDEEPEGDGGSLPWEQALAKKYWDRLFKEYSIADLSRYKHNQIALRWRTKDEVQKGKGHFQCGNRKCPEKEKLRTWEVNFAYQELGTRKNALVKIRLCPDCSYKLNYKSKKKEIVKKSKKKRKRSSLSREEEKDEDEDPSSKKLKNSQNKDSIEKNEKEQVSSESWKKPLALEKEKTREEDFAEYLEDMFL